MIGTNHRATDPLYGRRSVPYDRLASEYYDSEHLTIRNFEDSTAAFLSTNPFLRDQVRTGLVLDVGCGRGQLDHYFSSATSEHRYEIDESLEMLRLPRSGNVDALIRGDALDLPIRSALADTVTAFLFDPFNLTPFEFEVKRVLRPGGLFFGTIPSSTWAVPLRRRLRLPPNQTVFHLRSGQRVIVPSHTETPDELKARFRAAGFRDIRIAELPPAQGAHPLSRHIESVALDIGVDASKLHIVTTIACR